MYQRAAVTAWPHGRDRIWELIESGDLQRVVTADR